MGAAFETNPSAHEIVAGVPGCPANLPLQGKTTAVGDQFVSLPRDRSHIAICECLYVNDSHRSIDWLDGLAFSRIGENSRTHAAHRAIVEKTQTNSARILYRVRLSH